MKENTPKKIEEDEVPWIRKRLTPQRESFERKLMEQLFLDDPKEANNKESSSKSHSPAAASSPAASPVKKAVPLSNKALLTKPNVSISKQL